ncbi:hypothetical protein JCM8202v2_001771 [Rhodotorula sphaerocarpa]
MDARDNAPIRQNIQNLIQAGQQSGGSADREGTTRSLAQLMGASGQKRTHRVNTEMTEEEREETDKLEREMAATRAKWAGKGGDAAGAAGGGDGGGGGGLSLASLLTGKPSGRAATAPAALASADDRAAVAEPVPRDMTESPVQTRLEQSPKPVSPGPNETEAEKAEETEKAEKAAPSDESPRNEEARTPAAASTTRAPGGPPSPEKRRSVLERWGRDEPNLGQGSAPSSPRAVRTNSGDIFGSKAPAASPALARKPSEDEGGGVSPALLHATRDRPRPIKSTSRSGATSPLSPGLASPAAASPSTQKQPALPSPGPGSPNKARWQGAPISVKPTSSPPPQEVVTDESHQPAARHTRGFALPGLSAAAPPSGSQGARTPSPFSPSRAAPEATTPAAVQPTPPASPTKSAGGVSSVRAAAMRWGQQADPAAEEKRETLAAIKASYGVKAGPSSPTKPGAGSGSGTRMPPPPSPTKARAVGGEPQQLHEPAPVAPAISEPTEQVQKPTAKEETAPDRSQPKIGAADTRAEEPPLPSSSDILALVRSRPAPYHLASSGGGETLSLDVFHLNSPTDDPNPIDHNHVLHTTEILGIVHRAEDPQAQGVKTHFWVWRGNEARETKRTEERIVKLEDKTGVEAVEVEHRQEPPALAEAFEGQLTVCRGARDKFDHLATRMFTVRSEEGVVFVDEAAVAAQTLCSGYSTVFSALGEVFAWLGQGSIEAERHACCEFAEAVADDRTVTVLEEGEETAMFWHHLAGETEYASAQYWRRRRVEDRTSIVRVDPSASPSSRFTLLLEDPLPLDAVSVLDGGSAEHWVIVPERCARDREAVRMGLEAAEKLSKAWRERRFASRTPYHVIAFPSLIPRDLPHLARGLNLEALNEGAAGAGPKKMRVYTAEEAREEWA